MGSNKKIERIEWKFNDSFDPTNSDDIFDLVLELKDALNIIIDHINEQDKDS